MASRISKVVDEVMCVVFNESLCVVLHETHFDGYIGQQNNQYHNTLLIATTTVYDRCVEEYLCHYIILKKM